MNSIFSLNVLLKVIEAIESNYITSYLFVGIHIFKSVIRVSLIAKRSVLYLNENLL